jgi:simple sugar transport system permease protein
VRRSGALRVLAGSTGLVVAVGLAVGTAVAVLATSGQPGPALRAFFLGPLAGTYALGNMIDAAAPLTIAALGFVISYRASLYNLGGDGQIYASGLVSLIVAVRLAASAPVVGVTAAVGAAALTGGLMAALSGWLRRRFDTTELISTYLLSATVILVCDWLIAGPLDDPGGYLIATAEVPSSLRLASLLPPSRLSSGLVLAAVLLPLVHLFLFGSRAGYELRMCGTNPQFARYGAIDTGLYLVLPLAVSGAFHGMAGAVAVLGTFHRVVKGYTIGVGWSAVAVALIARGKPLWVGPAALFYAYLEAGARAVMLTGAVRYEMILIVQAVVLFLITAQALAALAAPGRRPS